MKNFWQQLDKPFFCLAPMADVTDCAFREIITKHGKPDVLWTEFVAADGLAHPVAREKLLIDLTYGTDEHPIVAQIFGSNPENIKSAAALCRELGFDGVDINMGCPDRTIEKQGAGAGMIKNVEKAIAIIRAAKEGAGDIPVSVKTRIGYNKNEIDTWLRAILKEGVAALTVHLRTRKEMSLVPAHWDLMPSVVALKNEVSPETILIGNGDVVDIDDARRKCEETGCDGVMLGRAIFGNPLLFKENKSVLSEVEGRNQKLSLMVEHTKLFEQKLGKIKNFAIMKKHYKAYVNGFDGAKDLRVQLMEAEDASGVEKIVTQFLASSDKIE